MIRRLKNDLTLPFFAYFGFLVLYSVLPVFLEGPVPERAVLIARLIGWFCASWWLLDDAARLRITLPMVYGTLTLVAFPLYVPFYLFRTRGWMAFVSLALYLLAFISIFGIHILVYLYR